MNSIGEAIRLRLQVYKKYSSAPGVKSIRAYWNWIRANYEMATGATEIKARPLRLTIDTTNACQLSCPMCPTGMKLPGRPISNLNQTLFQSLIEEIGDFVFFIDFFNWGEPLINNKLEEYIKNAAQKKIWTTISTNLSMPLSDQRIRSLIESGLSEMIVSADGASSETYPSYRRGGNFELVMQNMQRFVEMKKLLGRKNPFIIWRFLVFAFNENEISKASSLATEMGVDEIVFASPYVDYERFPDWIPKDKKFQMKFLQDHLELSTAGTSQTSIEKSSAEKHQTRCDWHYISAAINPDGSIAPCCAAFGKNNDFATFNEKDGETYMSAVNSEKYQTIRDRFAGRIDHPVDLICENCPTPEIMNLAKSVNQLISVLTAVQFLEGIKRIVLSPLRLFRDSNHH